MIMKKLFLYLLLLIPCLFSVVYGQNKEVKFCTLEECGNDTVRFFQKNYDYNPHYSGDLGNYGTRYIEQPFQVLIDEARGEGFVFHSYSWFFDGARIYFFIFVEPVEEALEKIRREAVCLCVKVGVGVLGEENRKRIREKKERKVYPIDEEFLKWVKLSTLYEVYDGCCEGYTLGYLVGMPKE